MDQKLFSNLLVVVIAAAIISILYAFILLRKVRKTKVLNEEVKRVSGYIKEGTVAFLKREYLIIAIFVVLIALLLAILGLFPAFKGTGGIGIWASLAFLLGTILSASSGFVGMLSAINSNALTAEAAETGGMPKALNKSFTGGAILGLGVAGFGLFGLTLLFFIFFKATNDITTAAQVVTGYGLGASFVALFARVGGGIYTKAADVGADLIGKIEANIPEDDPRNPAVIADNVGDNVGDIAGMGSDLLESFVGSIVSAVALGSVFWLNNGSLEHLIFPFLIASLGVIASIISIMIIRAKNWSKPAVTLNIATYIATLIVIAGSLVLSLVLMDSFKLFLTILVGVTAGILIGLIAELYTSDKSKAVKEISRQSLSGHATNIITGYSVGMRSTGLTTAVIVIAIILSYALGEYYGIAIAAVGMLSTVSITSSVDAYGPISDNAGGIAQMAGLDKSVREITDELDSVGNTTAAIGKGFSIGSATLTSLALFASYATASGLFNGGEGINILNPLVLGGLLVGAMLPFLFTSLTINSVGKASNAMIDEVRKQFENDSGILAGTSKPNYSGCVDIATKASLNEMIIPSLIAVLAPIITGFLFGKGALGGLLVGSLGSGSMLAIFMANSGGAWDNAKKLIETGVHGGRGTDAHKASVTGDTVGDPFKDTAGPAMNILIKLMSIIALILAPILVNMGDSLFELLIN